MDYYKEFQIIKKETLEYIFEKITIIKDINVDHYLKMDA